MVFYQQKDQVILMFPESSYLVPLNGAIDTQNPTTYPWYSKLNIIPSGQDWVMPIQIKEKLWGIGSGKYPDHIVNTEFAPVDFTLETVHQDARFLALAAGTCTSASNTAKEIQVITMADDYDTYAENDRFLIYIMNDSGHIECHQIYLDTVGDDGEYEAITGATKGRVQGTYDDMADLLATMETYIESVEGVTAVTVSGSTLTYTTIDNAGAVPKPRADNTNTGSITFSTTTKGASTHTFTEATDNTMKSFGLHIEQLNDSQDMIADLYGCIVTSYSITIDYAEKLIKESVGIRCPYYKEGVASVFHPPRRTETAPAIYADFIEVSGSSEYIIMDSTTTRTPAIVNTVTLTIENEIELFPGIGANYRKNVVSGKRTITMNIVGFAETNSLWTHWKDTWNDAAGQYTNATGKLNSALQIEKLADYDEWKLAICNWMIEAHSLRLIPIDDKLVGIDITFTGATPDSNKRLITSLVIDDYAEKLVYGVANS